MTRAGHHWCILVSHCFSPVPGAPGGAVEHHLRAIERSRFPIFSVSRAHGLYVRIHLNTFAWRQRITAGKQKLLMCQEPAQEIPPMTRSCRTRGNPWAIRPMTRSCGRVLMSKASGLNGPPGPARASTPESESVCLTNLCLSQALLTLAGGCP